MHRGISCIFGQRFRRLLSHFSTIPVFLPAKEDLRCPQVLIIKKKYAQYTVPHQLLHPFKTKSYVKYSSTDNEGISMGKSSKTYVSMDKDKDTNSNLNNTGTMTNTDSNIVVETVADTDADTDADTEVDPGTLYSPISTDKHIAKYIISDSSWSKSKKFYQDYSIMFSKYVQNDTKFIGLATKWLFKPYRFSRKSVYSRSVTTYYHPCKDSDYILELVNAQMVAAEWANMRADYANPEYFLTQANKIVSYHSSVRITVFRGSQLLDAGFRLMHAVGRASENYPIFINLEYRGNNYSSSLISLVGKGVCFDSGGLHLKSSSNISGMHMDKHGAASVLSAFRSAVRLQLPLNICASIGMVYNSVNGNSYHPLDIIKSRKGLTVYIGNTDAEGRLVLADCMNWVQTEYKVTNMLEMSTLTGAIVTALGKYRAGLFCNCDQLADEIKNISYQVYYHVWRMPIDYYHLKLVKPKHADLTNSSGKAEGASSQAAAFLSHFVYKGISWAHIDIAGVSNMYSYAQGYGAKLLLHYLRSKSTNNVNKQ